MASSYWGSHEESFYTQFTNEDKSPWSRPFAQKQWLIQSNTFMANTFMANNLNFNQAMTSQVS